MRKGLVILLCCTALLAAAAAALVCLPHTTVFQSYDIRLDRLACLACVFVAAVLGLCGMFALRIAGNRLAAHAAALDPNDTVSLCMIGYVLEKAGKPREALGFYAQALKLKPNDEMATRLMADIQLNQ